MKCMDQQDNTQSSNIPPVPAEQRDQQVNMGQTDSNQQPNISSTPATGQQDPQIVTNPPTQPVEMSASSKTNKFRNSQHLLPQLVLKVALREEII